MVFSTKWGLNFWDTIPLGKLFGNIVFLKRAIIGPAKLIVIGHLRVGCTLTACRYSAPQGAGIICGYESQT